MKRFSVRQCLGLAVGIALFSGCAKPKAQTGQPVVAAPPASTTVIVTPPSTPGGARPISSPAATPVAMTASAATLAEPGGPPPPAGTVQDTNGPAIEQKIAPAEPANMSPGVDEVARLAQGGVSEQVMVAYIQKFPGRFDVTADQIVYLNDLGVSSDVVTAMLKHDGSSAPVATTSPAPTAAVAQAPVGAPVAPAANVAVATPPATPPPTPSSDVAYFYDSLSPYGSWMYVSGYGWCWQPTVAVVGVGWQPYCDRGRWYWCDSGWYWHSDYSWGWAPFHYGRWYMHPHAGWIWAPGTVWGPAWVSWRYSEGYCGWAPLPPEAYWAPGIGFTFHGHHVSATFDFGLGFHHYAFVSVGSFCDPHPYRHLVPRTQVVNVYRNTTVVNNYTVVNNNVVNRGMGRETIARHSGTEIRQVHVQPTGFAAAADRTSRLERRGNDLVAYRPQLPKDPPVKPQVIQQRMAQDIRQPHQAAVGAVPAAGTPRSGRGNIAEPTARNVPGAVAPRATAPAVEGRPAPVAPSRPESARPEPRAVPPRNVPQRQVPAQPRENVTRPVETPAVPRVQTPAAAPMTRAYPETRSSVSSPVVTPPSTPRTPAQPSVSPRYAEQLNSRGPGYGGSTPGRDYSTSRGVGRESAPGYNAPHAAGNAGHGGSAPASRGEVSGGRGVERGDRGK